MRKSDSNDTLDEVFVDIVDMFHRILYIGAGRHVDPIRHFPECTSLVMVDMESQEKLFRDGNELLLDPRISYHFDTYLPDDFGNISSHNLFDTLLVSGHYPRECVLSVLTTPFHFVGYSRTYYPKDLQDVQEEDDSEHILARMMMWKRDGDMSAHLLSYTWVNIHTGAKKTFDTYDEFYAHYRENREI